MLDGPRVLADEHPGLTAARLADKDIDPPADADYRRNAQNDESADDERLSVD